MIILRKSGSGRLRMLLLLAAVLVAGTVYTVTRAGAQSRPVVLTIEVPAVFQIEPATESPLSIRITPGAAVPRQAMVLIRGLPPSIALTGGRLFDSGVWGVRIGDLPRLRIAAPGVAGEKRQLSFSLVTFDGTVLAEAASSLTVVAASQADRGPAATSVVAITPKAGEQRPAAAKKQEAVALAKPDGRSAPSTAKPPLTLEEIERAQLYLRKGEENLHAGNVIVARLFFSRAANAGWAPGALALATTYDMNELARLNVMGGIQPDTALARKWYEKAHELGAIEARDRLQRLGAR